MLTQVGGSSGLAVLVTGAVVLPLGLAPEAARDTLGGAVAVAEQLPDELGLAVLAVARDAFVQGLHLAAAISAAVAMATALTVMILLRGVRASAETEDQPEPASAGAATADGLTCSS